MSEKAVPTQKKACPFTFQVVRGPAKEEGKPGPSIVSAAPCIGVTCQCWIHDEAGPEYGNCALVLTGIFTAEATNRAATAATSAQQAQEHAAKMANAGNVAMVQFNAVLKASLENLTNTVERLADLVEDDAGDDDDMQGRA